MFEKKDGKMNQVLTKKMVCFHNDSFETVAECGYTRGGEKEYRVIRGPSDQTYWCDIATEINSCEW